MVFHLNFTANLNMSIIEQYKIDLKRVYDQYPYKRCRSFKTKYNLDRLELEVRQVQQKYDNILKETYPKYSEYAKYCNMLYKIEEEFELEKF